MLESQLLRQRPGHRTLDQEGSSGPAPSATCQELGVWERSPYPVGAQHMVPASPKPGAAPPPACGCLEPSAHAAPRREGLGAAPQLGGRAHSTHHHHHHRPTQDRTDVVASLRGSGSPVQIPYVPVLPDLAAVTQLSEGPPGALLTSSTNMWGTRPGLPVLRPSEPHHPYSGPSPWCLLPGEGRVAPTGEGIRSSPITSDFPMQEAGCSWRGSCELKRTTVLSEGQGRRDGVAGPFWAVGSVARVLHLHPTSC